MKQILLKLSRYFQSQWHLGVLAEGKGLWTVPWQHLSFLKAQNAMGRHIFIRPDDSVEPHYLMADDLTYELIQRHHQTANNEWKPGRLIVETSPENYQCWIRSDRPLTLDEKRYWLKRMHSDPGADPNYRWGRCPGFFNRKPKHRSPDGRYPLARLIWIDWKQIASVPLIGSSLKQQKSKLPGTEVCHMIQSIRRSDYEKGNESRTDFAYALALARRGMSEETIHSRIRQERKHWDHHAGEKRKQQYLDRTVANAIKIIKATSQQE